MRHWRRRMLLVKIGMALGLGAAAAGCQITASHTLPPVVSLGAPEAGEPATTRITARAVAEAEATPVVWNSADTNLPPLEKSSFEQPAEAPLPANDNVARVLPRGDAEKKPLPEKKRDEPDLSAPRILPSPNAVPPIVHDHPAGPARELDKRALPPYQIEPPDILLVEVLSKTEGLLKNDQPIRGQHLVRSDGYIGLGIYGSVFVGGMTFEQAREAVAEHLRNLPGRNLKVEAKDVSVDCLAYNSKFYYVITDGGGAGEQVIPFPITGSETVLDAIGRINGIPPVGDKCKVWVARRGPGSTGQVLPVDWNSIAQRGGTDTNYQLMPGDRIYVKADHWVAADSWLAKRLAPIERVLGATLLGSQTVNSIRNKTTSGTNP